MQWKLFGHILRHDRNIPPNKVMNNYFENPYNYNHWKGQAPHTHLLDTPQGPAIVRKRKKLITIQNLKELRASAQDRHHWKNNRTNHKRAFQ
jgi:hypothetical protein